MPKLITGPFLGLEGETRYSICFVTAHNAKTATIQVSEHTLLAQTIATLPNGLFWRAEFNCPPNQMGQAHTYRIVIDAENATSAHGDPHWQFHVPAEQEKPRMAYTSCNGFSDLKLMNTTCDHYTLWDRLWTQHTEQPFSLMMMGGDQVYADSIWSTVPTVKAWNTLPLKEKLQKKTNKATEEQLDRFYSQLYCERWQNPSMAKALASIPSLMMWDDHDIFDGWGSYPSALQQCPMYTAIYTAAAKYFELFQLRGAHHNTARIRSQNNTHYSLGVRFRGYTILALDNRSERSIEHIMSPTHWADVGTFLQNTTQGHLLLMAGVPVVYRDFSFAEKTLDATPWEEELTDDLKDHWRAKAHQGERAKLIMRLLNNAKTRTGKTVILSGDVHVGCLGIIQDKRSTPPINIHQLVSSGIVHPAPTALQWAGVQAITNDRPETLDENGLIQINMLTAFGAGPYFRTRNYLTLQEGSDNKLWANWECENQEKPLYPLN